jgi:transposase
MGEPDCPGCRRLEAEVARLREQVEQLTRLLEQTLRAGKRQAAPFSKGPPKGAPKRPGRKPGQDYGAKAHRPPPPPEQIDETHEAPLPDACPDCGGPVDETDIQQQYQVEIPRKPIHRQFNIHIGTCRQCQRRVQGRHELQTSDALGAAASQLGPDTQAALVELNKQAGLSQGKIVRCLQALFGIRLSRGGSIHAILRAGRRCADVYEQLTQSLPAAPWIVPDETGWRVGGERRWLHGLVSSTTTVYAIDRHRDGSVAQRCLGRDYAGVLIHDGWAPYDDFRKARHQQCLAHLLRRCRELLDQAARGAVRFPRQMLELFQQALRLRDRRQARQISAHGLAVARGSLRNHMLDALLPIKHHAANERFAKHLYNHRDQLWTFLEIPQIDATNWRAEHAMRCAVVLRKVWGGNRTEAGANAQAILMSLWRTCQQRGHDALDWLSHHLRQPAALFPLPP